MNLMTPAILSKLRKLIAEDDLVKFYKRGPWRTVRTEAIKRDKECQRCKREGGHGRPEVVHHIKEVKHHPELALLLSNTETLCKKCHNIEHPEKLGKRKKDRIVSEERW